MARQGNPMKHCQWCGKDGVARRYCSRKCRQTAWRLRKRCQLQRAHDERKRFAYADPPYPGMAYMYKDQPGTVGEVDHAALIERLEEGYDGWALSTSAKALGEVLALCAGIDDVRVCAWVKPIGVSSKTRGIHNTWEPLIVAPGRRERPGRRDWLRAHPARGGGDLIGRKPIAFAAWLFELLGMRPGDTLDDLYPGTGVIGRAWAQMSRLEPSLWDVE